jgi:hypothetical protein
LQFETSGALRSFRQWKIDSDEKTDGRVRGKVWVLGLAYYKGKSVILFIKRVLFASDTNFSEEFEGKFGFSVSHTTRVNLLY